MSCGSSSKSVKSIGFSGSGSCGGSGSDSAAGFGSFFGELLSFFGPANGHLPPNLKFSAMIVFIPLEPTSN
jgi:hypothetical protein